MKATTISLAIAFFSYIIPVAGQAPPDFSAMCKEQMKKLAYFAGQWEGTSKVQMGPGPEQTLSQTEDVRFKLDSTVLVIEGTGTNSNNEVVFNALAVVNLNTSTREYALRSFLQDGRSTEAYFKVIEDNKFEWGFNIPGNAGRVRYTIVLDPEAKTWHEEGEFSADGTTWMKFIDMQLHKKA